MASRCWGQPTILRTWHGSASLGSKAVAGVGVGECTSGSHKDSWHFREWADRSMSHRPADVETMNRQGDMPLPLCDLHFTGNFICCSMYRVYSSAARLFNLGDAKTYTAAKLYTLITCGLILFSFLNLTLTGLSTAQEIPRHRLWQIFLDWLVI